MRFLLLLLFLLPGANALFAQGSISKEYFFDPGPRWGIYDTKWYLNAAQISYFAWNDTSTLVTSAPFDYKFIRMKEKMEIGADRNPKDLTENTFFEYRVHFTDYDEFDDSIYTGTIDLYRSKRNAKRGNKSMGYYDFILNQHQLVLMQNELYPSPFDNLYFTKTMIFSKEKDTLELTTKILGNWEPEVLQNILWSDSPDTIVLNKVPTISIYNPGSTYYFGISDGYQTCSSNCFAIVTHTSNGDWIGSDSYPTPLYNYALDISKRQLLIFGDRNWEKPNKTFEIIELTNNQLKLVRLKD